MPVRCCTIQAMAIRIESDTAMQQCFEYQTIMQNP